MSETGRLDSWKEIAQFLNKDVSTVRRWERLYGLPVHRAGGRPGGSVYAYREEIAQWLRERDCASASSNAKPQAHPPVKASSPPPTEPGRTGAPGPVRSWRTANKLAWAVVAGVLLWISLAALSRLEHPEASAGIGTRLPIRVVFPPPALAADAPASYWQEATAAIVFENLLQAGMADKLIVPLTAPPGALTAEGATDLHLEVQQRSPGVRLRARLLTADQHALWNLEVSGSAQDIVALQYQIAAQVRDKLQHAVQSAPASPSFCGQGPSISAPEPPQQWVAQGWADLAQRSTESLREALQLFRRATELQPARAEAYVGLADTYTLLGFYCLPPALAGAAARAAALTAVELAPRDAGARAALAAVRALYDWNWPAAEAEFKRALALDPASAAAHHWYAVLWLVPQGRLASAEKELALAHRLDPASLIIQTDWAWVSELLAQQDTAARLYRSVLRADPGFVPAHFRLWEHDALHHDYHSALLHYRAAMRGSLPGPGNSDPVRFVRVLAVTADTPPEPSGFGFYSHAVACALLGDFSGAYLWLDRAVHQHDPALVYLGVDPIWTLVRSEKRFQRLLQRVGLPTGQRSKV
jgi:tetratricopeptide (TPR) repeat protein